MKAKVFLIGILWGTVLFPAVGQIPVRPSPTPASRVQAPRETPASPRTTGVSPARPTRTPIRVIRGSLWRGRTQPTTLTLTAPSLRATPVARAAAQATTTTAAVRTSAAPRSTAASTSPLPLRVRGPRPPEKIIVAAVGKEQLTLKDVEDQIALIKSRTLSGPKDVVERYRRAYGRQIYNDWVDATLLATEARARGITVTQEEMNLYIQGTALDSGLRIPLSERIRLLGVDEKKVAAMLTDAILGDKLVRQVIRERITDAMLAEAYNRNPGMFWFPPRRHARHLCWTLTGTETPEQLRDIQKKMNSIRRRLAWFGVKMDSYAQPDYSMPNLVYRDLGWLAVGEAITEKEKFIYDVVFRLAGVTPGREPQYALKVGQISEVLQSPAGFHIFEILEEQPGRRKTLEEARLDVEHTFFNQVREGLIKELEKKYRTYRDPEGFFESEPVAPEELEPAISGRIGSAPPVLPSTAAPLVIPPSLPARPASPPAAK
ncbi:MAG: peptidylprolyl isomerase [Candidatus Sumerlaeia bacterium]|nr:peptidylprolyl isomerase [Candidatus Sumerlaeia bacterium]